MRCTRSPACVRFFLLVRFPSGLGDRCRYQAGVLEPFALPNTSFVSLNKIGILAPFPLQCSDSRYIHKRFL